MEKGDKLEGGVRWASLGASCLALAVALGLAATTAYLEASRIRETDLLNQRVQALEKHNFILNNITSNLVAQLMALSKKEEEKTTSSYYDDEGDYYDDDSYDEDYREEEEEDKKKGTTGNQPTANRTRRSLSAHNYNMVISQGSPKRPHPIRIPNKVEAVVVIDPMEGGGGGGGGGKLEEQIGSTSVIGQPQPQLPPSNRYPHHHSTSPIHKTHQHYTPNYQEQVFTEERVRTGRNRGRNRGRAEDVEDIEDGSGGSPSSTPVAIQFGADTTRYRHSHHIHYDGNHRMYHPDGLFKDWSPSSWVTDAEANFLMENGQLTVLTPGLYYLYAQVFYADAHDTSGFKVYLNGMPILQCTTTALSVSGRLKRNSCYTGGLVALQPDDRVTLREVEGHRYTVFEPTKSFFGLFRVGRHGAQSP